MHKHGEKSQTLSNCAAPPKPGPANHWTLAPAAWLLVTKFDSSVTFSQPTLGLSFLRQMVYNCTPLCLLLHDNASTARSFPFYVFQAVHLQEPAALFYFTSPVLAVITNYHFAVSIGSRDQSTAQHVDYHNHTGTSKRCWDLRRRLTRQKTENPQSQPWTECSASCLK